MKASFKSSWNIEYFNFQTNLPGHRKLNNDYGPETKRKKNTLKPLESVSMAIGLNSRQILTLDSKQLKKFL